MATSGFEWSGGYTSCQEEGVTVGVPLENASNVLEELPASRTPLHEMVHATWCQSLTRDLFRSIPRWFHEGMAQWYENEGRRQFSGQSAKSVGGLGVSWKLAVDRRVLWLHIGR